MVLFCVFSNLYAQNLKVDDKTIPLGQDVVVLKKYNKVGAKSFYIHLHENETTSLEAGLEMVQNYGGTLITLSHSQEGKTNRNIRFRYRNRKYAIDPNRIFTRDRQILADNIADASNKKEIPNEVVDIVRHLADEILLEMTDAEYIIALHNNKNEPAEVKRKWLFWFSYEPESYSSKSYILSHDEPDESSSSSQAIFINPTYNNSEFFFVTRESDFRMLQSEGCSVILQNENPVDDGSLSVYAGHLGLRYFNSEVKHGKLDVQKSLLEKLIMALDEDR